MESVQHAHGDASLGDGLDRLGVQNSGPKVGELRHLGIGDGGERLGIRYDAWISGHHPVNIAPNPDLVGRQAVPDDRGAVVAASAPQSGAHAIYGGADESRHYGNDSSLKQGQQTRPGPRPGLVHERAGVAKVAVGHNDLGGLNRFCLESLVYHRRGSEAGRKPLSQPQHSVQTARRQLSQGPDALTEVLEPIQEGLRFSPQGARALGVSDTVGDGLFVALLKLAADQPIGSLVSRPGGGRGAPQAVGDAIHRRNNDHRGAPGLFKDARGDAPDTGNPLPSANACAPEFHDDHGSCS